MADVDVRRTGEKELQRRSEMEPLFFPTPSEFFSNPFSAMRRMSEEMDRAFSRMFGGLGTGARTGWIPAIDVAEHDGNLCVHADVPGMRPEDIKVEVTEDSLIIRGERRAEHEHRDEHTYRSERRYGSFYREIPLPDGAKTDQAKASFNNGVLEVSIPVPEQASKRREIPIQTGTTQAASAAAASAGTSSQNR